MEILNAVLAALDKLGLEYLILEFGGIILMIAIYFGMRKNNKLHTVILDNMDKHHKEVADKINNHHDKTVETLQNNHDEIDPAHLYSKINKFEDDLTTHQHEEVRLLHDVSKTVTKIDARLESVIVCREE
jgi:hypothetical protein